MFLLFCCKKSPTYVFISENRFINIEGKKLEIIQDPQFQRNGCRIDMDLALKMYNIDRLVVLYCGNMFINLPDR